MEQDDVEENQKEVATTADGSKEATRQNQKQNDVESSTESTEPDKSKTTREDENKPVNSKAGSNQTHTRSNGKQGKDSELKTKSTYTGDAHILPWYHVRVPMEKSHIITDEISRRKKIGQKYFTLTFSFPNPYPEFVGVDQDD